MKPWLVSFTGKEVQLLGTDPDSITIEDIAHALSNLCRYTGHSEVFYSVAEHSLLASYLVPRHLALEALLHDAAEAYLGDVATPLKRLLKEYSVIEEALETVIANKFKLAYPWPEEIKKADLQMLCVERHRLIADSPTEWESLRGVNAPDITLLRLSPDQAKVMFLNRYKALLAARDLGSGLPLL